MLVSLIVPNFWDNIVETRSLIPNLALRTRVVTSVYATVGIVDYQGTCTATVETKNSTCASNIAFSTSGIKLSREKTSLKCKRITTLTSTSPICEVQVFIQDFSFDDQAGQIDVISTDAFAYASKYTTNVTVFSGKEGEYASVLHTIKSDEARFFRGIANPTKFDLYTIQSTYTDVQRPYYNGTGFYLDFKAVTLGDQVDFRQFNQRIGLRFSFAFSKEINSLEIINNQKKSAPSIISEILGAVSGIISIVGVVMTRFEKYTIRLIKFFYGYDALDNEYEKKLLELINGTRTGAEELKPVPLPSPALSITTPTTPKPDIPLNSQNDGSISSTYLQVVPQANI